MDKAKELSFYAPRPLADLIHRMYTGRWLPIRERGDRNQFLRRAAKTLNRNGWRGGMTIQTAGIDTNTQSGATW